MGVTTISDQQAPATGQLVALWWEKGVPIITEYSWEDGHRLGTLTFANQAGRAYYQVGDLILTTKLTRSQLEEYYPQLKRAATDEPSALESAVGIAVTFLGWEESEYTVAWQIVSINPVRGARPGAGQVTVRRIIFLDAETPVVMDSFVVGQIQLNQNFTDYHTGRNLSALLPLILLAKFVAEIGLDCVSGGVGSHLRRKLAGKAAKYLVRRGLTKLIRVFMKCLASCLVTALGKAAITFAMELIKDLESRSASERLRLKLTGVLGAMCLSGPVLRASSAAATAFAEALVDGLEKQMARGFAGMEEAIGLVSGSIKRQLKVFLAKEVAKLFTTTLMSTITQAVGGAISKGIDENGKFDEAKFSAGLKEEFESKLTHPIRETLASWTERLAEHLTETFRP